MTVAHVHNTYQLVPFTYSEEVVKPSAEEMLLDTLTRSDGQVVASAQRTAEKFQHFMQQMQQRFATLATRNEGLCQELVTLEGQHREVKGVHNTETTTLQQKVAQLEQLVQQLRQEAAESTRQADGRVAAALTAQTAAVQTATQAGQNQLREAQAVHSAQVATLQTQLASSQATVETTRQQMAENTQASQVNIAAILAAHVTDLQAAETARQTQVTQLTKEKGAANKRIAVQEQAISWLLTKWGNKKTGIFSIPRTDQQKRAQLLQKFPM